MKPVQLLVLDPGHFHAALLQKESYPWVSNTAHVYAPLGPDLLDYMARIQRFNGREANPTAWELEVHAGPDYERRMFEERKGNVAVIAGRNQLKIGRIPASLEAGYDVLADKPWIIRSADLPRLEAALALAARNGLVGDDMMTERHEITSILQRELVRDSAVFGEPVPGTPDTPGIRARSVHNIMKLVAGAPLTRPPWFFDITQQGEALADVGTHVVDLVQWTAFADQAIDYRADIQIASARRWPTTLTPAQFQQVTGLAEFPQWLGPWVRGGTLEYYANNTVHYTLRGVHVALEILWDWQAPPGAGDVYEASFRGTQATVEIRQGAAENHRPELYVTPASAALRAKVAALPAQWPGITIEERGGEARIVIPDRYRVGHEAHFAQVANSFFARRGAPEETPAWELPNMLAKYYVTTRGVEISQS